ncbi:MAG: YvcK family protein [Parcubacteria group bacterium]|nr:YvcK family protein [Parcubacteria group bacterium]
MKKNTKRMPTIAVIGGGTGVYTVLAGLREFPVKLSAIISMADNGGSSGTLREEFGILPPGDIRRALVALSHRDRKLLSDLFNFRFPKGALKEHSFGNLMLAALGEVMGSFEKAVEAAAELLGVEGEVLPVTLDNVQLCAELEDGSIIRGETNIDIPKHDGRLRIRRVFLTPQALVNPKVRENLKAADMIVIGPGDLYTSVLPNLIVKGVREAIRGSTAIKVYVVNVMTKWGETNSFKASDFIRAMEHYLGKGVIDYAVINTRRPSRERLHTYAAERATFVKVDTRAAKPAPLLGDFVRPRGFIRHDPEKLARALLSLLPTV